MLPCNFSSRCCCMRVVFLNVLLSRRESLASFSCRKLAAPRRHLCGGLARKYLKQSKHTEIIGAATLREGGRGYNIRLRAKSFYHHGNRNRSAVCTGVRYQCHLLSSIPPSTSSVWQCHTGRGPVSTCVLLLLCRPLSLSRVSRPQQSTTLSDAVIRSHQTAQRKCGVGTFHHHFMTLQSTIHNRQRRPGLTWRKLKVFRWINFSFLKCEVGGQFFSWFVMFLLTHWPPQPPLISW